MMNSTKYIQPLIVIILFVLLLIPQLGLAQCPMCRAAAESSIKEGATHASGLNKGILYLFAFPYTMAAVLGFLWWKRQKNYKKSIE